MEQNSFTGLEEIYKDIGCYVLREYSSTYLWI